MKLLRCHQTLFSYSLFSYHFLAIATLSSLVTNAAIYLLLTIRANYKKNLDTSLIAC